MKITQLKVKNFKSFQDQTINYEHFTLLVGTNAAGKSNVINLFRFLGDIVEYGIDNAISLQGGLDYITNASIGRMQPTALGFIMEVSPSEGAFVSQSVDNILTEIRYEFEITPNKRGDGYQITKDQIKFICGAESILLKKTKNDLKIRATQNQKTSSLITAVNLLTNMIKNEMRLTKTYNEMILNKAAHYFPSLLMLHKSIRIYDFDPTLMKQSSQIASVRFLKEDGSNLANILLNILKNKEKRQIMTNLLRECLPFIEDIQPIKHFDQSISYKIKDIYHKKNFHANLLSDGTVNIIALIVALYFECDPSIIIIEEPERNLHPKLMRKIVELAKETSENKQVILTTHNPEFVKFTGINSLLLAKRDCDGSTKITKPADNQSVNIFLESELGIEDLFIQDILGE